MRKILVALVVCPLVALAQGPGGGQGNQGQGQGPAQGPNRGAGPGRGNPERMEKRMRLARTLGLAEALDLDTQQALRLGETMQKFDDRRLAAHRQLHDARQVLRKAASGEKVPAADIDAAVQRVFDARAQLVQSDREMLQTISKDLPAEKRARAALFLGRFEQRIERRMMMHGPGMGPGMGPGPGGPGMMGGPGRRMGMMGPGDGKPGFRGGRDDEQLDMCSGDDCPMDDEE